MIVVIFITIKQNKDVYMSENKKVKREKPIKFLSSTIGMMAKHENMYNSSMVRAEFYLSDSDNVIISAVSGYNLERIRNIPYKIITLEEYNNRPEDSCDDTVEWTWGLEQLGFEFNNDY